jgi:Tfp pilus assembly protein PilO
MKYQLTPLQVHLMGVAGITVLGAIGYFLAIEPVLNENALHMRRQSESASADRDAIVAEANVRSDRRTQELLQQRLDGINIKLESPSRTNDRIVRMTKLAEAHSLHIATLEPGTPTTRQRHTLVPVRFTGSSDFASMVSFIAALRTQFPDTRVDELELRSSGETSQFLLTCTWFAAPAGSAGVDDR